jgi:protease IV
MRRSLSDIDRSTAANESLTSVLFTAPKRRRRIPAHTRPVFQGLQSPICRSFLRLVANGNTGQVRKVCAIFSLLCLFVLVSLQSGCITVNLIEPSGPVQEVQLSGTGDGKVLLLDLSGVISSQDKEGLVPQSNMLAIFREELTRASKDDKVKAVVVRINSPGGTVTASDILYHELREFKAKKKVPVIASMMDVAASGGYYLAMAADSILVHPSTVTGSIGVIMLTVNARGLLEKVGVEANAITSGPRKDMGSPFRVMTAEERGIFQSVIDSFYQRFLAVVQEGRPHLSPDQIKKLADGRIYSGDQAKAAGLIDEIGYLDDAIEAAKKKAGLTEARVVTYGHRGEYKHNIYSRLLGGSPSITGLLNMDLLSMVRGGTPQFMYLWMP